MDHQNGYVVTQGYSAKVHLDFSLAHFVCKVQVLVPLLHSAAWACRERSFAFWLVTHRTPSCWGLGEEERGAQVLSLLHLNPTRSSRTSKAIISHPGLHLLKVLLFPLPCLLSLSHNYKEAEPMSSALLDPYLLCVHHTSSFAHSRSFMCVG